jgi:hypothetical protein
MRGSLCQRHGEQASQASRSEREHCSRPLVGHLLDPGLYQSHLAAAEPKANTEVRPYETFFVAGFMM